MSGIAGIIRFDGKPADHTQIAAMTSAMARRGPDEINHWMHGAVALGHCMLRTTPESLGQSQPLVGYNESLVLVMDGRFDNRADIARALRRKGTALRTHSDAELLLHAYMVWGKDCPQRFIGNFAFAIWDTHRNTLFCARDHLGIKPFYYTLNSKFFSFASDGKRLGSRLPKYLAGRTRTALRAFSCRNSTVLTSTPPGFATS